MNLYIAVWLIFQALYQETLQDVTTCYFIQEICLSFMIKFKLAPYYNIQSAGAGDETNGFGL